MTFSLLALPLGLLIGVSLGALGGGGSILTVPALVYTVGENPRQATTAALVIVGVAALTGIIGHARSRRVRWGPGLVFGAAGAMVHRQRSAQRESALTTEAPRTLRVAAELRTASCGAPRPRG